MLSFILETATNYDSTGDSALISESFSEKYPENAAPSLGSSFLSVFLTKNSLINLLKYKKIRRMQKIPLAILFARIYNEVAKKLRK